MSKTEIILSYFKVNPGIHPLKDLTEIGAYRNLVRKLVNDNILTEVSRGYYQLPGYEPETSFDLVEVSSIVQNGVFCLASALFIHGVGTQMPNNYHIAIPIGQSATQKKDYPIKTYYYSPAIYNTGIEDHGEIKVYSVAKTVADCFKFRNKIGIAVALEALKYSLREKKTTIPEIFEMAEICRVKKVIMPYIEGYLS